MDHSPSSNSSDISIQEANSAHIFDLLETVYWNGVEREICAAVLAYQEIKHCQPDLTRYELDNSDLDGINFKRFCTLLSKY
jgi:hypothetical protein